MIMADDIDDLLNEIEQNLTRNESRKREVCKDDAKRRIPDNKQNVFSSRTQPPSSSLTNESNDFSDILSDNWDTDVCVQHAASHRKVQADKASTSTAGKLKCFPVCIGGSNVTSGLSTSINKRPCDRLRCTGCDFAVSSFNDVQWSDDTDYLFLRNNMPDFHRVRTKLVPKTGSRAYACQCKWMTASALIELHSEPHIKWVCGKH